MGEAIKRRHLFGKDAVRAQGAIKQEASPTIREAVVEYAGQSLELMRISREQARPQSEAMRRNLQTCGDEGRIILEVDPPIAGREPPDGDGAVAEVEADAHGVDGGDLQVRQPRLREGLGVDSRTSFIDAKSCGLRFRGL